MCRKIIILIFIGIFSFLLSQSYAQSISSNPSVSVFVTGAYVTWQTTTAANSRVDYGTTISYGSYVSDGSSITHHVLTITGLIANTTYHYKVTSGSTESSDFTFTTYANPTGTVRTVGSGKTHATIGACVSASVAGDTCLIYAGSYNETVTPRSGSGGSSYFTILAQEAAIVKAFNIPSGGSYISIKGFEVTGGASCVTSGGNSSYVTFENNYMHDSSDDLFAPNDSNVSNNWIVRKNLMYNSGYKTIFMTGSNILIDENDISYSKNDIFYGGLTNSVIRNNNAHDYAPAVPGDSSYHTDFIQWDGSAAVAWTYSLIEGNTAQRCVDSSGNCHVIILRNPGGSPASANTIIRYNYAQKIDGAGIMLGGGSSDSVPYGRVYNNTFALESRTNEAGNFITLYMSENTKILNNLSYNSILPPKFPFGHSTTGGLNNYNIAYDSINPTASWDAPYSSEATYASLKNKNPLFSNYPYERAIQSNSPAVDAGGALTTVAAGDSGSGTTLVLNDVRFFQPGWAGTQPDWIAIGTVSNVVQISSINYNTNTITLANSITRSNGQSVWLYKKSDGVRVLYGTATDIGAYEYGEATSNYGEATSNIGSGVTVGGGITLR